MPRFREINADHNAKECWTCCRGSAKMAIEATKDNSQIPTIEDVSVSISVNNKQLAMTSEDPCWKVCWDFIPKCPEPMV
jgi:hypothetical protein